MGARREAQNLLTPSAGRKTMAVSEPRAKWAAGLLETATLGGTHSSQVLATSVNTSASLARECLFPG